MPKYMIPINDEQLANFANFLDEKVRLMLDARHQRNTRYDEIDRLLASDEPYESLNYEDATNNVSAVTQTRVEGVIDRIVDAYFSQRPCCKITTIKGVDTAANVDWNNVAKECTDWFDYAARSPRMLNAQSVIESAVRDGVKYGICCVKVINYREAKRSGTYDMSSDSWKFDEQEVVFYTGPRWFYVSARDMLWLDGYGQDLQALPIFGYVKRMMVGQIKSLEMQKQYEPNAAQQVIDYIEQSSPSEVRRDQVQLHDRLDREVLELWVSYDINGDGYEEELLVDYYYPTQSILRIVFNPYRQRPFFSERLRQVTGTSFDGQGVPDILRGVQTQVDLLTNVTMDAGKGGARYIVLSRANTPIGDMLKDETIKIAPGDQFVTTEPTGDVHTVPLGDPRIAVALLPLIEHTRRDANELVGIGPAQLGDLSVAHRAAAFSIEALLREGATFTRAASSRLATMLAQAVVQTFEVIRREKNLELVYRITGDDGVETEKLFSMPESLQDTWAVAVEFATPENSPDNITQRNMMIGQFLLSWLERAMQASVMVGSDQINEATKGVVSIFANASAEVAKRVVQYSREMQDIQHFIPDLAQILPMLQEAARVENEQKRQEMLQQIEKMKADLSPKAR